VNIDAWLHIATDAATLAEAVTARYASGPFVPVDPDGPWLRRVEIAEARVRETGASFGHRGEFLAHALADRIREPVQLQWDGSDRAYEIIPGDTGSRDVDRRPVDAAWEPSTVMTYGFDLARQRGLESRFEAELDERLGKLFPIQNKQRTARIDRKKQNVYGPNARYAPGMHRYQREIVVELQLALFAWSADGNDRTLVETRKEALPFARYDLVTPTGALVHRGDEHVIPFDEYALEFHAAMARFAQRVRRVLGEHPSLQSATLKSIFDPES
jgi:hypothetical protein